MGCIAIILCLLTGGVAVADVIIIANDDGASGPLDRELIKKIFLGKKTQWDDGNRVFPAILKNDRIHREFLKSVVMKSPVQYRTFWKQAIFTGTGTPPKSFASEEELVDYVAGTKGAIGYIDAATPHEGVKVLSIR